MPVNRTNTLLDQLNAQQSNLDKHPNIQMNTYDSLQRQLQRYMRRSYGVNITASGANFLVVAVHGKNNPDGTLNTSSTGKNIIYLANFAYTFPAGTAMVLTTPMNNLLNVTVRGYVGSGAIEVNENLVVDIININSSSASYSDANSFQTAYTQFPFLTYTGALVK